MATSTAEVMHGFALEALDASGQKRVKVDGVQRDWTVRELVGRLLPPMRLRDRDATGKPVTYRARLDREGRSLHGSELVGDALLPEDRITLQPHIQAGASVFREAW